MNDFETMDIVCWILEQMGLKTLSYHARNQDASLDMYINYIKYKVKSNHRLIELVEYYL